MGFAEKKKPSELIDLAKTSNFSCKLPCFRVFLKFSAKNLQKVWGFVKNHQNSPMRNENDLGASEEIYVEVGKFRKKKK